MKRLPITSNYCVHRAIQFPKDLKSIKKRYPNTVKPLKNHPKPRCNIVKTMLPFNFDTLLYESPPPFSIAPCQGMSLEPVIFSSFHTHTPQHRNLSVITAPFSLHMHNT